MPASDEGKEGRSLLVRNLRFETSPTKVRHVFEKYGEVRDVYLPLDYHTKKPRGFGFVEFFSEGDAIAAARAVDKTLIEGNQVTCVLAQDRRKSPDTMRRIYTDTAREGGDGRDRSPRGGRYGGRGRSRSRDRGYGSGARDSSSYGGGGHHHGSSSSSHYHTSGGGGNSSAVAYSRGGGGGDDEERYGGGGHRRSRGPYGYAEEGEGGSRRGGSSSAAYDQSSRHSHHHSSSGRAEYSRTSGAGHYSASGGSRGRIDEAPTRHRPSEYSSPPPQSRQHRSVRDDVVYYSRSNAANVKPRSGGDFGERDTRDTIGGAKNSEDLGRSVGRYDEVANGRRASRSTSSVGHQREGPIPQQRRRGSGSREEALIDGRGNDVAVGRYDDLDGRRPVRGGDLDEDERVAVKGHMKLHGSPVEDLPHHEDGKRLHRSVSNEDMRPSRQHHDSRYIEPVSTSHVRESELSDVNRETYPAEDPLVGSGVGHPSSFSGVVGATRRVVEEHGGEASYHRYGGGGHRRADNDEVEVDGRVRDRSDDTRGGRGGYGDLRRDIVDERA